MKLKMFCQVQYVEIFNFMISENGIKLKELFTNVQKVKKLISKKLSLDEDYISDLMDAEINLQGVSNKSI